MNFKPVTLSFFIFFLGISSHVNAQEIVETPPPSEFVYIQKSKTGTLVDSKDDYYTLTLKGNHLHLIYFADQPERITGEEVLSVFFDSWKSLDPDKKPPTAFINYSMFTPSADEGVTPDVLELQNPEYCKETDTLTFQVKPLHEHQIKLGVLENVVIIYDKN